MSAVTVRPDTHLPRVAIVGLLGLSLAYVVQTSILPALGLPSAIPVEAVAIAVLASSLGARIGAVAGFAAGLVTDLVGFGVLGVGALIGCLLGAYVGSVRTTRWRWSGFLTIWVASSAAAILFALVNSVLAGLPVVLSSGWLWIVGGALVCSVVLLPMRSWVRAAVR